MTEATEVEVVRGAWFANGIPTMRGEPISREEMNQLFRFIVGREIVDRRSRLAHCAEQDRAALTREAEKEEHEVRRTVAAFIGAAAFMFGIPPDVLGLSLPDGRALDVGSLVWQDVNRYFGHGVPPRLVE